MSVHSIFQLPSTRLFHTVTLLMKAAGTTSKLPLRVARIKLKRGQTYDKTCDFLDVLDKRIHIKQRALACQTKALSDMLLRYIYVMGNACVIWRDAEMIYLHPDLGETRCLELRNLSCLPLTFIPFTAGEGRKKIPPKKSHSLAVTGLEALSKSSFFWPSHCNTSDSNRKPLYGGHSTPSSNQSHCLNRGNSNNTGNKGYFKAHRRGRGHGNPSSH